MSAKIVAAIVVAVAIGAGGYWIGSRQASPVASTAEVKGASPAAGGTTASTAAGAPSSGERKVLYWYDPMSPQSRFDKPGKSPFMDMDLVPRYADEVDEGGVAVASRLQQSLGIRTAEVRRTKVDSTFSAVGNVILDERSIAVVAARTNGIVERLAVRAAGDPVRRGQSLATLYVPEWAAAQAEYLAIRNARLTNGEPLLAAARERLKIAFMPEDVIARVEATGTPQPRVGVASPVDGFVVEVMARDGAQVAMGMPLLRLASLASVWVQIDVPESQAALARPGLSVEARSTAFPDRTFSGRIETILPEVDPATRTLKARVVLRNPGDALRPGMYAALTIKAPAATRESLVIPQEAVIATGKRTVVIVAEAEGKFRPVDVTTGREIGDDVEIRSGLREGQRVVASGQFLIDSEASLRSALPRIGGESDQQGGASSSDAPQKATVTTGKAGTAGVATYRAEGTVEAVSAKALTIAHGPVPSLKWPGMTMGFLPPTSGIPPGLKAGDPIRFEFIRAPDDDWQIVSIERTPAAASRSGQGAAVDPHAGHGSPTPSAAGAAAEKGGAK